MWGGKARRAAGYCCCGRRAKVALGAAVRGATLSYNSGEGEGVRISGELPSFRSLSRREVMS